MGAEALNGVPRPNIRKSLCPNGVVTTKTMVPFGSGNQRFNYPDSVYDE